jgi:hypothetical protein
MSTAKVADIYQASSALARFPFEPYWPEKKLKICVTGAGGFIARCDPSAGRQGEAVEEVHREIARWRQMRPCVSFAHIVPFSP